MEEIVHRIIGSGGFKHGFNELNECRSLQKLPKSKVYHFVWKEKSMNIIISILPADQNSSRIVLKINSFKILFYFAYFKHISFHGSLVDANSTTRVQFPAIVKYHIMLTFLDPLLFININTFNENINITVNYIPSFISFLAELHSPGLDWLAEFLSMKKVCICQWSFTNCASYPLPQQQNRWCEKIMQKIKDKIVWSKCVRHWKKYWGDKYRKPKAEPSNSSISLD